ncbi:MAG: aminopeptidase N [Lautropia sp.]|nr:aminopeptidase N [Lautropia sp.]
MDDTSLPSQPAPPISAESSIDPPAPLPSCTGPQSITVHRRDYRAPDWLAEGLVLHFRLDRSRTVVTARCRYRRAPQANVGTPLLLDGEGLLTLAIQIDDQPLSAEHWQIANGRLRLDNLPDAFTLHTQVVIDPSNNLELSGLYASGDMLLTQCEAQGFRRITWFQDRPDVMTTYRVILQARQDEFPVLLANGNLLAADAPAAIDALRALALPLPPMTPCSTSGEPSRHHAVPAETASQPPGRSGVPHAEHTHQSHDRVDSAAGISERHEHGSTQMAVAPLSDPPDGWHQAIWEDPFPKPSYLFALVAGRLAVNECTHTLASGREVLLQIWSDPAQIHRTDFALASLKKAIAWDERRYGLELDLDRFMIVAAADFNMGAMENKGLNIFNAKYLFADPAVSTDEDFVWIESIIAHEYFHNWTGNRITCRDWFQLTLKEGLTVFRDQEFSADVMAAEAGPEAAVSVRTLQRMVNVRQLRQTQFTEDAGPMRHPIRPDSYQAIDNFYTATVYEKGAEVVRMLQTLVGREGFRHGMDLYFERHDGQAVTCDAFVAAMGDANGRDFSQFMRWYATAGTPHLQIDSEYDADGARMHLDIRQYLPDDSNQLAPLGKGALHVPIQMALLSREDGSEQASALLELTQDTQRFSFEGIHSRDRRGPIPSLLRDFSAPVVIDHHYDDDELAFLIAHDANLFNRWEASQQLAERALMWAVEHPGQSNSSLVHLGEALGHALQDPALDDGLRQQFLVWPDENHLAEKSALIDPPALRRARQSATRQLVRTLSPLLQSAAGSRHWQTPYSLSVPAMGRRALANTALIHLNGIQAEGSAELARAQFEQADNMTDRLAALQALIKASPEQAQWALDQFEARYRDEANVLDKWFALQARMHPAEGQRSIDRIRHLMKHPAWNGQNPNKVRALLWTFFADNLPEFHLPDGSGYQLWQDEVLRLDRSNPLLAARLARALNRHDKFVAPLAGLMHDALERVARDAASPDVREVVGKALGHG